ncbi:MAG: two-component system CheB/CheR fusion protein [Planctomycetota bacterium]|jgi:two-component system CheB/CheR fusion protein
MNQELVEANEFAEFAHAELRDRYEELETFNRVAVGREVCMLELKEQLNDCDARLGEPLPFDLEGIDGQDSE